MPIEKILFPTKFQELSLNALESVLILNKADLKEIILCHVISREDVGFVPFGGYLQQEENKIREEVRIRFEDWQKTISEKGVDSKIIIKIGDPISQILHAAEDENADLLVLGQKRREVMEFLTGSNTIKIITRSKIPTLISKSIVHCKVNDEEYEKVNDRIFKSPMLVTNWTEQCKRALDTLISLKGVIGKVIVFHNIDVHISESHDKDELHDMEKSCLLRMNSYCDQLRSHGIEAEPHLGAGDIMDECLRISRERQASMIVIGTTGKNRFYEMLHKSISHEIAKISELPTLLVP